MNTFQLKIIRNTLFFSTLLFSLLSFNACQKEEKLEPNEDAGLLQTPNFDGSGLTGGRNGSGNGGSGGGGSIGNAAWTSIADFPGMARSAGSSFALNGKGYVGLGEDYPDFYKDFYAYDPISNAWAQIADFPAGGRRDALSFVIEGYAYVGLGYGEENGGGFDELSDLWKYSDSTNTWTQVASFPSFYTEGVSVFVHNKKAYILTGSDKVFEYNPSNDTWTELGLFPGETRSDGISFTLNGIGYTATGYDDGDLARLGDSWKYNISSDSWTKLDSFPGEVRNNAVGFALDGMGVMVGGDGFVTSKNDTWVYNPQSDEWSQATSYPEKGIGGGVGFVIGNTAYVGTGYVPDNFLGDVSKKFYSLSIN